jgi:hypothetical protein
MDLFANGFWTIVQHNWIWMLIAAAIGVFIGWKTCEQVPDSSN